MENERLNESLADIESLVRRVAWELMDEDQRDELMIKVVVPRWGKTSSDGVLLKATAWARMVGATVDAIDGRYRRLRRSEGQESPPPQWDTQEARDLRASKRVLREHPELAAKLLEDPEVSSVVEDAVRARMRDEEEAHRQRREHIINSYSTFRQMHAVDAVYDLRSACDRFARQGAEALQKCGELPSTERYLLGEAANRASQTLHAVQRYMELGRTEIDIELTSILDEGV